MDYGKVAFVGGGNMTRAIAGGLLDDGFDARNLSIAEPQEAQRELLARELPGAHVSASNTDVVSRCGSVVLSVKPQIIADVCKDIAAVVQAGKTLVISIAAGPRIDDIDHWLGGGNSVVRVMPNQPALIRRGVSGIFANAATSDEQMRAAGRIMSAVGPVVQVLEEQHIDSVTAVSGSGPAYFFLLIDMLAKSGEALGLEPESASILALETALGAASLAHESGESMDTLIARVRSPGGTTAAALDCLEDRGVRAIFDQALSAAKNRATELADIAHESGKNQNP